MRYHAYARARLAVRSGLRFAVGLTPAVY